MRTIGIIGAMEEEIISLKRKIAIEDIQEKAGMTFYSGTVKDKKVVLVRCGIGKVNAAVCTQILIDLFEVEYIISTGVAGGLHPDSHIGDVILASDTKESNSASAFLEVNKKLIKMAERVAKDTVKDHNIWVGHIASEDQFVGSMGVNGEISSTFTAYCAEMEGAAVAYTCFLNQIPFGVIRTISDQANPSVDMNFDEFVHVFARNMSKMVEQIIEEI